MTEMESIISETVDSLVREFEANGVATIDLVAFNDFEIFDGIPETTLCSFIETEWQEGIYYDALTNRCFFYGEPRSYSCGGRRWAILVTTDLLPLIPAGLLHNLKKVAITGLPITFNLEGPFLLEYDPIQTIQQ
jgi:hypothetical protein